MEITLTGLPHANKITYLSIGTDAINKKIIASKLVSGYGIHSYFAGEKYLGVELYGKDNIAKLNITINGNDDCSVAVEKLNNYPYSDGDYFKFFHAEARRMFITGYVENAPKDLSQNCEGFDLSTSYFYIINEGLVYSDKLLTVKDYLKIHIKTSTDLLKGEYEYNSYKQYQEEVNTIAQRCQENQNLNDDQCRTEIINLKTAFNKLKKKSIINIKGQNNEVYLKLEMDYESKKFLSVGKSGPIDTGNSERKYMGLSIYSKSGIKKLGYDIRGKEGTLELAQILNNTTYETGDYIKIFHQESSTKIDISQLEDNLSVDYNKGYFYINIENIKYNTTMKEISSNKEELVTLVNRLKTLDMTSLVKESKFELEKEIKEAQNLINTPFVGLEQIEEKIGKLNVAENTLKYKNRIECRGRLYQGGAHEFLALEYDYIGRIIKTTELHNNSIHSLISDLYCTITLYSKDGKEKVRASVTGHDKAEVLHKAFNNCPYKKGDYLQFYYREPEKMRIRGYVEGVTYDLSTDNGCATLNLATGRFYMDKEYFVYKDMAVIKGSLEKEIYKLVNNKMRTFDLEKDIVEAHTILVCEKSTVEDLEKITEKLKAKYN